ncbi:pilus assembly protein [Chiayiivirga flava]|uniref:Type IV pilus assembly protein PilY1 n=1 Tax=Chiayiivirga flava TaxID=659595 RepID=A0A7W8D9R1_9GAMM|nr:PilC/PilY family type IV pilus protein [Chiayiivirga flava]MBB5209370.1 type IV pilus assembly protein PilY1 [Chiayiivirga flava]
MRFLPLRLLAVTATLVVLAGHSAPAWSALDVAQSPLYLESATPPLNMLVMGKDHKLYYEAYNDASDLNGDGILDIGYKGWELKSPAPSDPEESRYKIDYYGYFNSYACYSYTAGKFSPVSATTNKQCSGTWSGDFLNYLTTGRGDALKKVLYGGDRFVDTDSSTVLQTNYVTHDAHSWGKEYLSVARDGYNIASYTPLPLPSANRYHLFAVTSLTNPDGSADGGAPVLRVLRSSPYRIWEWVSIEGPVADTRCLHGGNGPDCVGTTTPAHPGHPGSRAAFNTMETTYAIAANQYGGTVSRNSINCQDNNCNPNGTDDDYLSIATGMFRIRDQNAAGGTYRFRIDGDDVIDFELRTNQNWGNATGLVATAGCYTTAGRGFGACAGNEMTASVTLSRNTRYYYKFRHEEGAGGDGYRLQWTKTAGSVVLDPRLFGWTTFDATSDHQGNVNTGAAEAPSFNFYNLRPPQSNGSSRDADRFVRVEVCPSTAALREDNCKEYPDGNYKPTGVLHDYGETDRMFFGLISGSQVNNLQGGVLRRNVLSFQEEINADDGTFKIGAGDNAVLDGADGIVGTIKSLRMIGGSGGQGSNWAWGGGTGDCPSIGNRAIVNGECRMWGNPIGEMMFEALRYFAGGEAYSGFTATPSGHGNGVGEETTLKLATPAWKDPYESVADGGLGYRACAKPVMTVVSDINPSYDSDLPGNPWNSVSITSPATISSFNANTVGGQIWNHEFGGARDVYIGQSGTAASDSAPSAKSASSFGNIRGLSPEEPTKEGTYYSAAVAYYGKTNDAINENSVENLSTYSVAVASPLPKIEFPVGNNKLTLLPFAKTVSGTFGDGTRKPTNTIVDFYVEKIVNLPGQPSDTAINAGRGYALFRINYEDVEQGNDHDMDAIVRYEVKQNANSTVTVTLTSEYAAGSANHAIGYTMTGSTKDGIYLEVCDLRDGQPNDGTTASCAHQTNYAFNTPPGRDPGYCATNPTSSECAGLPPTTTRTFTVGSSGATVLRDPLWYAAKYGGFDDNDNDGVPDSGEWDSKVAGTPDNYFLVTNALTLKDQLAEAFSEIEADSQPTGGVAASGARRDAGFLAFIPSYFTSNWTGDINAYRLDADGEIGDKVWSAAESMPEPSARNIFAVRVPGKTATREVGAFTRAGLTSGSSTAQTRLGLPTLSNDQIDDVIDYLRGDQTLEQQNGGTFRDRDRLLGDILNSQPEVLNTGNYSYVRLLPEDGGDSYNEFLDDKSERTPVLFVGANDGMLHAFDATETGGEEIFAVIPNSSLPNLKELIDPNYTHRYFVDASAVQRDAYINGGWKTVLLSGMGAGGKSIIALDVTDPAAGFTASNVMWEFTHPDMGYSFGQPRVGVLQDGTWVAVFGNGYNSARQRASLFVVRLSDGELLKQIEVETISDAQALLDPNGMSSPELASLDDDIYIDTAYVGDYHGNLWKINLGGASSTWGIAGGGNEPMFQAHGPAVTGFPDGKRQIITGSIGLSRHHLGGLMVFFGTGRYMLTGDNAVEADPDIETFYGLWDNAGKNAVATIADRSALQQQQLGQQGSTESSIARTGSNNAVRWDEKSGWFLDLKLNGLDPRGERVLGLPTVGLGRVVFTTFTPVGNECEPGGENWLYVLNASTGGVSLPTGEFTAATNGGDDSVGGGDCTGDCTVASSSLGSGPPTVAPPIVTTPPSTEPDPATGAALCSSSKIRIQVLTPDGLKEFTCMTPGRSSWREIR